MLTAKKLRKMKSNLFATAETIEQVVELSNDAVSVMIAVNTTLELLATQAEDNSTLNDIDDWLDTLSDAEIRNLNRLVDVHCETRKWS